MVEKETGFVEINGFPIHYDKFGTGNQPVLLIPGAIGKLFIFVLFIIYKLK